MEESYLELLRLLMVSPEVESRNGKTRSIFGYELCCDLAKGFPLLTTKKMQWGSIKEELLFFLSGKTDTNLLKTRIWEQNTKETNGEMGPMYGFNWRHFGADYPIGEDNNGFDQIAEVENRLSNPHDRRVMMTTFNPSTVHLGVLPPCHGIVTQFYNDGERLHCKTYQRSADVFLGLPFNIASYALLTHIMAKKAKLQPGKLTISMGCVHLYEEHYIAAATQILRNPLTPPRLVNEEIVDYGHYPAIKAKMIL
jgi:thymidylate synthase